MADFIDTYEGANWIGTAGIPTTVTLDLSTKSVDSTNPFTRASTYATRGAASGTGYAQKTYTGWTKTGGTFATIQGTWQTNAATDWPNNCRSCVASTGSGAGAKMLWAWNLQTGGGARDMSAANTTEIVRGTIKIA